MSTHAHPPHGRALVVSSVGALGIVYGDIGTSPLYAVRECFHHTHGLTLSAPDVMGVLSLIVWSLILVVTVKYLVYVMRADNSGEGGILALFALATSRDKPMSRQLFVYAIGLFGAALLYGDGIITPAISVLSAVEGIGVEAPALEPAVIPITVAILIALFAVQSRGTERVGLAFGPVMLLWFTTLGVLGVVWIVRRPEILWALSPHYAVMFFMHHGLAGGIVLGSVFLVVTGGEALYADMGHFGRRPIQLAWIVVVFPGLVVHYFGQGALLLAQPGAIEHPLMFMAPSWARILLLVLASCATVIASQALISGVFSLTRQAILLGYAPRLRVVHTSAKQIGQIYMPSINAALAVATILLVLAFRSSSALAAAYGIAVTMTMIITTMLAHVVARRRWGWGWLGASALTAGLLSLDLAYFASNAVKIADGGWVPLLVGVAVFVLLTTWSRGRAILAQRMRERSMPIAGLPRWIAELAPTEVPGVAVYMTAHPDAAPVSLVENVRHNHAIHERIVLLSLAFEQSARVSIGNRLTVQRIDQRIVRLTGHYGFVERPDVPSLLELALAEGIEIDPATVTYVMGRETLLATNRPGMAMWRESLFALMSRNAQRAAAFFGIPSDRVLEIGTQIEL